MEQGTGVEPASEAWEAPIIADILTLRGETHYSRAAWEIQVFFVAGFCGQNVLYWAHQIMEVPEMAEYEMVHEIKNMCRNNQMRDVFFKEVECDDPVAYVRSILKGKDIEIDTEYSDQGTVTVHAVVDGLIQKFVVTQI